MKNTLTCLVALIMVALLTPVLGQDLTPDGPNWYQEARTKETPQNINTIKAYSSLHNKTGRPVIVAVIDSGIDIEHEDLKDVIWINNDEIPDNGIDDDNNGYIDDIYGWNFIGGKDGSHVSHDTYEMTRLYGQYKEEFKNADPSKLSKSDKERYKQYVKWGKKIDSEVKSAKANYQNYEQQYNFFREVIDHIKVVESQIEFTPDVIDSLGSSFNQLDAISANIYRQFKQDFGEYPTVELLENDILASLQEPLDYFGSKFKYGYNPDFNPRGIVGDDYDNKQERHYGNNSVEGPDARHGTHVAGIIAATQDNGIGMNGIAKNTRIMVLRAVPDGDERDKDIANSIYYAVDNGADVINMSFGKGHSPYKEVVDDAIRYAEKKDVLLVHAAGNSNQQIEKDNNFPNDHFAKPKGFLFFRKKQPKNYITVGASGPTNDQSLAASFSNYSKTDVDIFAPGEEIYSTVPDDQYESLQGTSMAAPVVAGVAALIRSYYPTLSAPQVKEILIDASTPIDIKVKKPGTDMLVPFSSLSVAGGIIDVQAALDKAAATKGKKKFKKSKERA